MSVPKTARKRKNRAESAAQAIGKSAREQIYDLATFVASNSGAPTAAIELYRTAAFATSLLTLLCQKHPELFTAHAAERAQWPVLYSPHPQRRENVADFVDWLAVGTKTGLNYAAPGKSFSYEKPANVVALTLYAMARSLQRAPIREWEQPDWVPFYPLGQPGNVAAYCGRATVYSKTQWKAFASWARVNPGSKLLGLSKDTAGEWAEATKSLFDSVYGEDFDRHPHLQELRLASMGAKDALRKSGRRGTVRNRMRKSVLQAWHSIASIAPLA